MRTASAIAMLVVVIALLTAGGGALKLYMDRQAMQGMIGDYGATLATLPLPPGQALQSFVAARERSEAGDFGTAKQKLREGAAAFAQETAMSAMGTESDQGGSGMPGGGPGLPEGMNRPGGGGPMGMGGNPGAEQVQAAIDQARTMLQRGRQMGMNTGPVAALVDQAQALLKQGKPEQAVGKLREAQQAAMQSVRGRGAGGPGGFRGRGGPGGRGGFPGMPGRGRMPGGMRPGMPGGPMPPGMPGGGPGGMMNPMFMVMPALFGLAMGELQTESPLLRGILDDLDAAGSMILGTNPDQVKETLGRANGKLLNIRKKRDELGKKMDAEQQKAMQAMRSQGPGGPPGGPGQPGGPGRRQGRWQGPGQPGVGQPPFGPGRGGSPFDPQQAHDLIGRALDEARDLSPAEYAQTKEDVVRRLMEGLLAKGRPGPMTPVGPVAGPGLPPIEAPKDEPTDLAARSKLEAAIRERLRQIQEPYTKLREIGVDMTQVAKLVQGARKSVNDAKLIEAAKTANHASDLVFQLLDMHRDEVTRLLQGGKGEQ